MNRAFGRDVRYVSTIGLSQIAGGQFLHVYKPRHWINAGQAGPLGWTLPAALGVAVADPEAEVVALSGDYDFQFMIEELAVGAQFQIPYVHVLVNNAYLGLIRQSQRGFEMDYHVQLSFDNINASEDLVQGAKGYGVDHVQVAEGLGCKAMRVFDPDELGNAFAQARKLAERVPRAGGGRGDLGAGDQRLDGHRARQRDRVRGTGAARRRRPDRDLDAGLTDWPSMSTTPGSQSSSARASTVLIAPDKFKGSLEAADVAADLAVGLLSVRPDCRGRPGAGGRRRRRHRGRRRWTPATGR